MEFRFKVIFGTTIKSQHNQLNKIQEDYRGIKKPVELSSEFEGQYSVISRIKLRKTKVRNPLDAKKTNATDGETRIRRRL